MAGFKAVTVKTTPDGTVDQEDFHRKLDEKVAVLMITNPNTVGIFEPQIQEMIVAVHAAGGVVYLDGANMNAILGVTRPGDWTVKVSICNTSIHTRPSVGLTEVVAREPVPFASPKTLLPICPPP